MWYDSVIETIGQTPLVKLHHFLKEGNGTLLAKIECFNPGHSVKDRIALKMIEEAEKSGKLQPGGTIIEGTSGNTGMGLALIAAVKGYKCVFTTTDKQSMEKVNLLRAMGCEVQICPTNVSPDDPRSYYSVAKRLNEEIPNSFYPDQYNNLDNRLAHYETTGPEIWEQTDGRITHFVAGMGTAGTITGAAQYLKEQNPDIQVIGIDSVGSVFKSYFKTGVFDPRHISPYLTEGIGEDIIPDNLDVGYIDEIIQCPDREAFLTTRKLARKEGIFVGGSSGAAVWGALNYIQNHPLNKESIMVILLPDSGTRYVSKIFNDEWMKTNGFIEEDAFRVLEKAAAMLNEQRRPLIIADVDNSVEEAIRLMNEHQISQLPVGNKGKIVGSLTEGKILNLLTQSIHHKKKKTGQIMEKPFPIVEKDLKVDQISLMLSKGVSAVLVRLEKDHYSIVTRNDLINALSEVSSE